MKRTALVILLPVMIGVALSACSRKPKTSCVYGDAIPAPVLDPAMQAGDTIIMALEQDRFQEVYALAGDMLRKTQTPEQFKMVLQSVKDNLGSLSFSRLEEAYHLTNKAGKKFPTVMVPCSLGEEGMNDIYQAPGNSEIVSLIYKTMGEVDSATVLIELIKENESWKLLSLSLTPSMAHGQNVDDFVKLARKAREENKPRLAAMYYRIAFLLSNLSPNVDEFVARKTTEEGSQVKADYVPLGTIQSWTIDSRTKAQVFNVDALFDKGEPWVNIEWLAEDIEDSARLKEVSGKLLDFAFKTFPEYREFFKGIIVTGRSQDPRMASRAYREFREFPPGK